MHTVNFLAGLIEHHQATVYFLIFLGILLEGEFILLCTGILLHLGALDPVLAVFFTLLGGFSKTLLGYHIGYVVYNRYNHLGFFKYVEKKIFNVMPNFEQKPFWSIFVSKFILLNHLVILYSGYKKINFRRYLRAEISATLIWVPLLLILGYVFSSAALRISSEIWEFLIVIFILFTMFFLFDKLVSWLYELFEEFYDKSH